ncbi:MAG: hypothetical protein ACYS5V_12515, partial [Planctomycetota bacterium]
MDVDVRRTVGRIDPLWFGHNLEHTRSVIFGGLGAQLIRNRKFAGAVSPEGIVRHWHRIGDEGCLFMPQRPAGKRGTAGDAYVRRFDPDVPGGGQCQRIQRFGRGRRCGIGQRGIFLDGEREYELRLALLAEGAMTVRVRVAGAADYLETVREVEPRAWTELSLGFACPDADPDARLEIGLQTPGVLCVGAVSLQRADHFHGMRPDVIELLKQIGAGILRWPGGNFAGSYRWKDGLLPADRRAPLWGAGILPHTDGIDEHEIGTDEFVALCRAIGAEPWITINMSLEGPVEAGQWVEYCNGPPDSEWGRLRTERGHPEPFAVKYWSLGNEMGYGHMGGPNDPDGYAAMAADCARAMKAADPSIVLVASGTWEKDEWYRRVLATAGDCFDHVSYHEYTDLTQAYDGRAGAEEFRRIVTSPARTVDILSDIRRRLDAHAPGGKQVGISFDEWNVWYAWFRRGGVLEGVYTAAMLNMFCRQARRLGMTLGAYFEPVNEGAIRVEPDGCHLTAAGEVFRLFGGHHGNELIEAGSPEQDGLDVAASVDPGSRKVFLTLVNCEPEAARKV